MTDAQRLWMATSLATLAVAPFAVASGPVAISSLELSAIVMHLPWGEPFDCAQGALNASQAALCERAVPKSLPLPSVDSETGPGWWSQEVHDDHIHQSCGYARAQLGGQTCMLGFGGERRVFTVGVIYCPCYQDPDGQTTGNVHNYLDPDPNSVNWLYTVFIGGRAAGYSYPECHDFSSGPGRYTSADGGINDQRSPGSHCYVAPPDIKGTWGIYADFEKVEGDEGRATTHVHRD